MEFWWTFEFAEITPILVWFFKQYIITQYSSFWSNGHEEMRGDFPQHACLRKYNTALYTNNFWKIINTNARKMLKSKMCHSRWYYKNWNQTFSYRFFVAAILDEKSFLALVHFCIPSNKDCRRFIWNAVCMRNLKIDVRQANGVLSLECEKTIGTSLMTSYLYKRMRK